MILEPALSITLQDAFNNSGPNEDYDKYVILDPSNIYTGGLGIYEGKVFIDCNGATIDVLDFVDISDDEVIGVKSTAIKFKNNLNLFIGTCYLISSTIILLVMMILKINYCLVFLIFFMFSLFYQIKFYDLKKSESCLKAFKLNNLSGLIVFLGFVLLTVNVDEIR